SASQKTGHPRGSANPSVRQTWANRERRERREGTARRNGEATQRDTRRALLTSRSCSCERALPAYLAASCRTSPVTEPDPSVRLESDRPCCRTTAEGAAEQWIPPAAPAALRGLQADGVYASSPAPECVFPLVPTPAKSAPSPKVA